MSLSKTKMMEAIAAGDDLGKQVEPLSEEVILFQLHGRGEEWQEAGEHDTVAGLLANVNIRCVIVATFPAYQAQVARVSL